MKIRFLGVGNSFCKAGVWQSNAVLESNDRYFLIDCGSDFRHSVAEQYGDVADFAKQLSGVFVTHLHSDHTGGLEGLGFLSKFHPSLSIQPLYSKAEILSELWTGHLSAGMSCIAGSDDETLASYFDPRPLGDDSCVMFEGSTIMPIPSCHIDPVDLQSIGKMNYGLEIHTDIGCVYYSGDRTFNIDRWNTDDQYSDVYLSASKIFHECETDKKSGVHSHYEDLVKLPDEVKSKMWLYHYGERGPENYGWCEDGFAGWVKTGDSFELGGV